MKKKTILTAMLIVTVLIIAVSVTLVRSPRGTITVYSQGDYISKDVLRSFTRSTHIEVDYVVFGGSESGTPLFLENCDVVLGDGELMARLLKESQLMPLSDDLDDVISGIDAALLHRADDPEQSYTIPCLWTGMGILYNPTLSDVRITGWSDLSDPDYTGQILMPSDSRQAFSVALAALGLDVNTKSDEDIGAAGQMLSEQCALVREYCSGSELGAHFTADEAVIAPCYAIQAMHLMAAQPELSFVYPNEGSWCMVFSYAIPQSTDQAGLAETFLHYMCQKEQLAKNSIYSGLSTTSYAARDLQDPTWKANPLAYPLTDDPAKLLPALNGQSEEVSANVQVRWLSIQEHWREMHRENNQSSPPAQ